MNAVDLVRELAEVVLEGEPSPEWAKDLGQGETYTFSDAEAVEVLEDFVRTARRITK